MSKPSTELDLLWGRRCARVPRALVWLPLAWLLLFLAAGGVRDRASAQCSMCGQAVAQAGSSPEQVYATLTGAVLVLLVPTVLLLGALGALLWKHRG